MEVVSTQRIGSHAGEPRRARSARRQRRPKRIHTASLPPRCARGMRCTACRITTRLLAEHLDLCARRRSRPSGNSKGGRRKPGGTAGGSPRRPGRDETDKGRHPRDGEPSPAAFDSPVVVSFRRAKGRHHLPWRQPSRSRTQPLAGAQARAGYRGKAREGDAEGPPERREDGRASQEDTAGRRGASGQANRRFDGSEGRFLWADPPADLRDRGYS